MSRKKSLSDKINLNTPGGRIKSVRLSSGLNQYKFAKLLGIKQGTLSDIETGKRKPSERILIAIEYRFSILPEQILTGEQNKSIYSTHKGRKKYTIPPDPIDQMIKGAKQIFNSNNPILIQALTLNIAAFQMAAKMSDDQKNQINELIDMCEEISERISSLEEQSRKGAPGETRHREDITKKSAT